MADGSCSYCACALVSPSPSLGDILLPVYRGRAGLRSIGGVLIFGARARLSDMKKFECVVPGSGIKGDPYTATSVG